MKYDVLNHLFRVQKSVHSFEAFKNNNLDDEYNLSLESG